MSPCHQTCGWSEDRVATLARLWADGLSASQIAEQLGGVSRSAVLGKVHRLGLGGRATPAAPRRAAQRIARTPRPQRVVAPRPAIAKPPAVMASPSAPEGPGLVRCLADLGARACRWPIGDPKMADFSFCGRPAEGRYCAGHEARSVSPGKAWRPESDPIVRRALAGLV